MINLEEAYQALPFRAQTLHLKKKDKKQMWFFQQETRPNPVKYRPGMSFLDATELLPHFLPNPRSVSASPTTKPAAPGGSKMIIIEDLGLSSQSRGAFKSGQSSRFSPIHSITYSCKEWHLFVSMEYKNTLSASHFSKPFRGITPLIPMHWLPQQHLHYPKAFLKRLGGACR